MADRSVIPCATMLSDDSHPDLILLLRRDGSVATHGGGRAVSHLWIDAQGRLACSAATTALVRQLVRRAIVQRMPMEARFQEQGCDYDVRVTPQGPDRAIAVIRVVLPESRDDTLEVIGARQRPGLDRRGFLRRLRESIALAALREESLALVVLHLDGIADIAQVMGPAIAERVVSHAFLRLSAAAKADAQSKLVGYLGQLSDEVLAIVMNTADREALEERVIQTCASLREPVALGDAEFHLTPYAGVALLSASTSTAKALLDQARAAANEARRSAATVPYFYNDTLQLESIARLDLARELREAIAQGQIHCRYIPRHELTTGRLAAWIGYLRWLHPVRGEIPPSQFLRVAASTGQSVTLSRMILHRVCSDFARLSQHDVRISFGALREHIISDDFLTDLTRALEEHGLPEERVELRIDEKTFVARGPAMLDPLRNTGVQLVVDEVGREMSSLAYLARSHVWGLQLDRAWVSALRNDAIARKVCRAGIAMATSLELTPIATGIDNAAQRDALLELGCRYGSGDLYTQPADAIALRAAQSSQP